MEHLTFGEQLKIILGRKGMTIKELAETIESETGKKMSRQNLTQRIGRDNFQEQDMRMIAGILNLDFTLSILPLKTVSLEQEKEDTSPERPVKKKSTKVALTPAESLLDEVLQTATTQEEKEVDITIGEFYDMHEELSQQAEEKAEKEAEEASFRISGTKSSIEDAADTKSKEEQEADFRANGVFLRREGVADKIIKREKTGTPKKQPLRTKEEVKEIEAMEEQENYEADERLGDIDPNSKTEYEHNSVRSHPSRIGYVQVYDRSIHQWMDMTEWAFRGYQERKRALLGERYVPPVYLE